MVARIIKEGVPINSSSSLYLLKPLLLSNRRRQYYGFDVRAKITTRLNPGFST